MLPARDDDDDDDDLKIERDKSFNFLEKKFRIGIKKGRYESMYQMLRGQF